MDFCWNIENVAEFGLISCELVHDILDPYYAHTGIISYAREYEYFDTNTTQHYHTIVLRAN